VAEHVAGHSVSTVVLLLVALPDVLTAPRHRGVARTLALSGAALLAVAAATQLVEGAAAFGHRAGAHGTGLDASLVGPHGLAIQLSQALVLPVVRGLLLIVLSVITRLLTTLVRRRRTGR